ncbi:MAG TPA: hypothetical protein VHK90_15880, partial [Thermoanaerobaculia bacterium]|nr:hypothetical protein [Thermoanaerobaculia bacterium]
FYETLMKVSVRNTYYEDRICPDFSATPSVATAAMMNSVGLLFRPETDGFSVLYDVNRRADLLGYLRRQTSNGQNWSRVSVELALKNVFFGNFTNVPNDLDPTLRNYAFTNQQAHREDGVVLLQPNRYVTRDELLEIVPPQFEVPLRDDVCAVVVRDISNEVVECLPRCVPKGLAKTMAGMSIQCRDVRAFFADAAPPADRCDGVRVGWTCRHSVFVTFSGLPEGRYVIQEVDRRNNVLREKHVLYVAAGQYVFIDLLFTAPEENATGIYPIRNLGTRPVIESVQYELHFKRRTTYWRYYVVLPRKRNLDSVSIRTDPPGAATFCGPYEVVIGNGTPASLFVSEQPLPMSTRPPARFILESGDGTLMESMPVASFKQILPEADSTPAGNPPRFVPSFRDYSDIYVYV